MTPIVRLSLSSLVGASVGVLLIPLVALFYAGGHGTTLPSTLIFPWAMLTTLLKPSASNWVLDSVFLVQMPLYTFVIALFWTGNRHRALMAVLSVIVLHSVAVACCFLPRSVYSLIFL